jgi:Glycosyltransferase family 87
MILSLREALHQPYFTTILTMLACICFYLLKTGVNFSKIYIRIFIFFIFFVSSAIFAGTIYNRISHPQVWDFTAFYLYGQVAATGHNFYLPENFQSVFSSLQLPHLDYTDLIEQSVDVGFLYPPPTILLFAPLGFFPYEVALVLWTIFILLFGIGCIYLVFEMFFKKYRLYGLMFVATLFFLLAPTRATVFFSQTNFIVLFWLLLMKKYAHKKYAGVFLAMAFLTKPYMIIFAMAFLLIKNWNAIAYFIVTTTVFAGITFFLFGKAPFMTYVFNNPSTHLPHRVFSEDINQSLNAVLIRTHLIKMNAPFAYTLILISVLLLVVALLILLVKRNRSEYIWGILLLAVLLIYPGTLSYYGVLLLFIVCQFWDDSKEQGIRNPYLIVSFTGIFYFLSSISVFAAIVFLFVVIIIKSLKNFKDSTLNPSSAIRE